MLAVAVVALELLRLFATVVVTANIDAVAKLVAAAILMLLLMLCSLLLVLLSLLLRLLLFVQLLCLLLLLCKRNVRLSCYKTQLALRFGLFEIFV